MLWDERYDCAEYVYGEEPNSFLVSVADQIPLGNLLSLAEGEGRNAVYLAALGHRVLAVDSSAVGLAKAQRLARARGVRIETCLADLCQFPIEEGRWDGIVSIFCHLPPGPRAALYRRVVAGLRPGGVLVLEAYTPEQLELKTGGPSSSELLVTLDDVRRELAGLQFRHACEVRRPVLEGILHTGVGAVLQLVAVKP